jgi:predicted Fe-Mo cluster-binding NifX family protein
MIRKIILFLVVIFMSLTVAYASETDSGKIAVAADSDTQTATVSNQAARCAYYLIFDNSGKLLEVIDNPYKDARGGAGPSVVSFLSRNGVTEIIAEAFGSKMIDAMKSKGIKYFELSGSADEAVNRILKSR